MKNKLPRGWSCRANTNTEDDPTFFFFPKGGNVFKYGKYYVFTPLPEHVETINGMLHGLPTSWEDKGVFVFVLDRFVGHVENYVTTTFPGACFAVTNKHVIVWQPRVCPNLGDQFAKLTSIHRWCHRENDCGLVKDPGVWRRVLRKKGLVDDVIPLVQAFLDERETTACGGVRANMLPYTYWNRRKPLRGCQYVGELEDGMSVRYRMPLRAPLSLVEEGCIVS